MFSKVEYALLMRSHSRKNRGLQESRLKEQARGSSHEINRFRELRSNVSFRTPSRENHARREIVRREAIDASTPANPNRMQLRADSLTPPWGNTNAQSPERRALVALAPGTVKHNSYRRMGPRSAQLSALAEHDQGRRRMRLDLFELVRQSVSGPLGLRHCRERQRNALALEPAIGTNRLMAPIANAEMADDHERRAS
jgi:hypothetical protein